MQLGPLRTLVSSSPASSLLLPTKRRALLLAQLTHKPNNPSSSRRFSTRLLDSTRTMASSSAPNGSDAKSDAGNPFSKLKKRFSVLGNKRNSTIPGANSGSAPAAPKTSAAPAAAAAAAAAPGSSVKKTDEPKADSASAPPPVPKEASKITVDGAPTSADAAATKPAEVTDASKASASETLDGAPAGVSSEPAAPHTRQQSEASEKQAVEAATAVKKEQPTIPADGDTSVGNASRDLSSSKPSTPSLASRIIGAATATTATATPAVIAGSKDKGEKEDGTPASAAEAVSAVAAPTTTTTTAAPPPAVPAKDPPGLLRAQTGQSSLKSIGRTPSAVSGTSVGTGAGVAGEAAARDAAAKTPLLSTDKSMPDYTPEARSLSGPKETLRDIYPAIEPYDKGLMQVDGTHTIYWQWSGNKNGAPVVFLHGGPGGGTTNGDARWFDPEHYRVLCFDQRGAGKSTPTAELKNNTTWDLVADIEKLREHFKVDKWAMVFGGSWGSTLSLAYAQKHPERVGSLVLRGIFTLRKSELQFFYQDGASHLFPDQFKPYREHIPEKERGDLIKAYYKRLTHKDESTRLQAARRWSTWENATSKLYVDVNAIAQGENDQWALAFARIESHFFINAGWMKDGQLLEKSNLDKIRKIPAVIVQGRYDVVCPAQTAWDLHERWPEAEFHLVPDAGHSAREKGIAHLLLKATDKFRELSKSSSSSSSS